MTLDLLPCRWRGDERAGWYPCTSAKLVQLDPRGVTANVCQSCYCRDHEPVVLPLPAQRSRRDWLAPLPCRHRGEPTGETADCLLCGGRRVALTLYPCAIHERCTADAVGAVKDVMKCGNCSDREVS